MSETSSPYDYNGVHANSGANQFNGPIRGNIILNSKDDSTSNQFQNLSQTKKDDYLIAYAKLEHHVVAVEKLILAGADVNAQDASNGQTVLHCAVESENFPCIAILKRYHALYDKQDHRGQTPIHYAAEFCKYDTIATLLDDQTLSISLRRVLDMPDQEGKAALYLAWHGVRDSIDDTLEADETHTVREKIVNLLLAKGANHRLGYHLEEDPEFLDQQY